MVDMYNMNASGLLPLPSGEGAGATPRTPEILNSLMAMTNPFDAMRGGGPRVASSPPSDSTSSSCGSSTSPPSVQHTCSQLIKEGLKLTIQTKRRNNPSSSLSDEPPSKPSSRADELTPEDEERRRRRRERNKIAATKCRLKKRERTVNLVQESEILETQNHDLKSQIQDLENERRRLVDMLSVHRPSCSKQLPFTNTISPSTYQDTYTTCATSSSVETRSNQYQPYPATYCKVEVDCERYDSSNTHVSGNTYQRVEAVEETGFTRPHSNSILTYHTFEQNEVKEPATVLPFCRLVGDISENYARMESGCSSLSLDNSHSYVRSHVSTTRQYSRPSTLGISTYQYDNKDILDSPSVAPTNYHHFDEDDDNYTAGFPSGSCIT